MKILNKHTDIIPPGAVSIMRPGPWGNPFVIGRDGDRATVIRRYRAWLWTRLDGGENDARMHELAKLFKAPALVCCCKPAACHGDVLAEAAAWAWACTR